MVQLQLLTREKNYKKRQQNNTKNSISFSSTHTHILVRTHSLANSYTTIHLIINTITLSKYRENMCIIEGLLLAYSFM